MELQSTADASRPESASIKKPSSHAWICCLIVKFGVLVHLSFHSVRFLVTVTRRSNSFEPDLVENAARPKLLLITSLALFRDQGQERGRTPARFFVFVFSLLPLSLLECKIIFLLAH